MTIKEQLMNDMKEAMRAREQERLTTIRFLMAELKNAEIDGANDDDQSSQKIIASQVKKSKEAMVEFQKAGRDDLVTQEEAKVKVMEKYLPEQISEEKLVEIAKAVMSENQGLQQGQLIGLIMKQTAGQADGKRVQEIIVKLSQ